ncbi:MAG: choice-of-anchor I family protein [Oscillatoriophycideae cyanobacterium NC_groundwater_1537_Pr4_S-0.65um_50_18]|nr:choice-of-anchor I family protein [Oscillatoriophycideae cyanobacterium NC_groundwater_1537_Pr4_S-0.65um_50_18]
MVAFSPSDPNSQNFSISSTPDSASSLKKIGGFLGTGSEISAYDPSSKRLFIVSGGTRLQVLDLSNPSSPTLVKTLDVSSYGSAANSVAISNGWVAVAVEGSPRTSPGKVVFFSTSGEVCSAVTVGAVPDMVTFTPDGQKVLVANEGEPSSYGQPDSIDPVGSVSIIDLFSASTPTVTTVSFESFNAQKADLQGRGVRITSPNATVAQDFEPEYITVSADGKTAWVTLQENNAIALIDIATAKVTSILPLGLKDFSKGLPSVTTYEFGDRPPLGTTATVNPSDPSQTTAGQEILLGGFSGLFFEGTAANGNLKFITTTDRGPNGEPTELNASNPGLERPFALPDFQPQIVRFELDRSTGKISLTEQIKLSRADGTPITGLPNLQNGAAGTAYTDEVGVDLFGNILTNDSLGADTEGIVVAADGSFWLVDEYRPAIYHFDQTGKLIDRFIPEGAPTANGEFGTPALPAVYAQRRSNRGFEAVALEGNKLYAFIQSAIDNPDSAADTASRTSRTSRILEFDIVTKQVTGEYLYVQDDISASGTAKTDKIGDAVSLGNGKFLVVERDDRSTASSNKLIYEIDLKGATNINRAANLTKVPTGKTIEQLTVAELDSAGLNPVDKRLVTNAAAIGYTGVEKLEGLALIDANTIAIVNDNDFGLAGGVVSGDGSITGLSNTPIKLGIIEFNQSNGLDASDRDGAGGTGKINIQPQPVFGLYQPDAIASYSFNGQTYLVLANEGDARDYTGFADEIRVGSSAYKLDPTLFPNAAALKDNAVLGRLTVSAVSGDTDGDGDFDRIELIGGRSFSIRDAAGNLVFDSGNQLELITAAAVPTLFNSNGAADTFDTRSDNKGPEAEGITVGAVNGRTYAFVGLERTGGVMVYEITNPNKPLFVEYVSTAEDVSPEGLTFISADKSPNGKPLLITTNEVSNTTAIFEFAPPTRISDIQGSSHISPLVGKTVTDVRGIVTAVTNNGFYLQDPNPDASDATSEAIFVFRGSSGSKPKVGDSLKVTGRVDEFRASGRNNDLSVTQINGTVTGAGFTVLLSNNSLPTATVMGAGGRVPPNKIISNDAVGGNVENAGSVFDPAEDGIDFYESLEGMRVQINNAVAVSPTNNFGEIAVLADNGANAGIRTARGGINIQPEDFNPERIIVDDVITSRPPDVNVGDRFTNAITGVLDYSFSNFKLLNTAPLQVTSAGLQKEITALVGGTDQLTVATFNVENLDPKLEDVSKVSGQTARNVDDDLGSGKFAALADRIINNLKSPDILSLEEIQDSTGGELNDGVVDADLTFQTLIHAIKAAGGPTYEYRSINPVEGQDGGQPGGNIRVGFLFNPERVEFVDRPGGGSTTSTTVTAGELSASPGRIDPTNPAFNNSRKPLVGEFLFNGNKVYVIANHFNSKGGDQPLFGRFQPPTLTTEAQRLEQAQIVRSFVDKLLVADPHANVLVVGDINDFQFSNPIQVLTAGGALSTLIDTLPISEQYTYNFEGNAQVLDHILVSSSLKPKAEVDVVHINSEFVDQDSDHDPIVSRLTLTPQLRGTPANDVLVGTAAAEKIVGGLGNDQLTGNGGSDRFSISTATGTDTVTDFTPGQDLIQLTGGLGFNQLSIVQGTGASAHDALLQVGSETIAILMGVQATTLTASNFAIG